MSDLAFQELSSPILSSATDALPHLYLTAPLLFPFFAAALGFALWRFPLAQRATSLVGVAGSLITAWALFMRVNEGGVIASPMGGWPAPYGISLVADLFSAVMVLITATIGTVVFVVSLSYRESLQSHPGFHPLVHILLLGVTGAFLTGDLFNLYVWFEVLLMASFVLLSLGGTKDQLEGGFKYVTINLISSALFLAGAGILYGMVGTLNMADLAGRVRGTEPSLAINAVAGLFIVAFGLKAAVFPLFFWLPASYHTPATPIAALFAGLLTKVGVYALIRVFTLIFVTDVPSTHALLLAIACATMLLGVLGAMIQNDYKKVLSMHIVSQIGYMIMGLALFTPLAVAGAVFYIIHHIIVKTNLFLIAGVFEKKFGTTNLKGIGGLYQSTPWMAVLFLISAFSLAGIPPLSGFFPKLTLVMAGLETEAFITVGISLFVSLCTLYSMVKLWSEGFLKAAPRTAPCRDNSLSLGIAISAMALITVFLSLNADKVFSLSERIAAQLMNPLEYIRAMNLDSLSTEEIR
jgi:multicomponent Na+:H+ antiporter subunit D